MSDNRLLGGILLAACLLLVVAGVPPSQALPVAGSGPDMAAPPPMVAQVVSTPVPETPPPATPVPDAPPAADPPPAATIDWANVRMPDHASPVEAPPEKQAPPPAAPPPSPPGDALPAAAATYTVQAGDTLYAIARRFGVTVTALVSANNIANPSRIPVGLVLVIPAGDAAPPPAAPPPAAPPPVAPPVTGATYVVQRGDNLTAIAQQFGVTVASLVSTNRLINPNWLYVGQVLQLPAAAPATPAPPPATPTPVPAPAEPPPATAPGAATYTVQRGDTLSIIAGRFGVTVPALAAANKLVNPSLIYVGQQLVIPPATTAPAPVPPAEDELARMFIWPADNRRLYQWYWWAHQAIDIDVLVGTPMQAAAAGTVEFAGWNNYGYGYLVVLDHGHGVRTLYAHNSELLVEDGQQVQQGETVALSGSTGYSTVPHLHFGILVNGRAVDPCGYLPDGCG